MLVLTRKQGEKIQIGEDVVITVVRTKGKTVRLGIQAPAHVPVLRGEIAVAIAGEAQRSAHAGRDESPADDGGDLGGGVSRLPSCSVSALGAPGSHGPLHAMLAAR